MMKKLVAIVLSLLMLCSGMAVAESVAFTAGTYNASANGIGGAIPVTVTFSDSRIESIEIGANGETEGIGTPVLETMPAKIIEHQSLAIDSVSGATITSTALIAAVTDCVTQAGGNVEALMVPIEKTAAENVEMTADIVVVGGGAAGLSAALAAYEAGAENIILVEKNARLGGDAYISGGIIQGVGSKAHAERGLTDDTPEAWLEYWNTICEGKFNAPLVEKVIRMSGDTCDWMAGLGVEYNPVLTAQGETTVTRALTAANQVGGKGLMQPLIDALYANGITVLMNTTGTSILQAEDGAAIGVTAVDNESGAEIVIHADAVIMSTGDYEQEQIRATGAKFIYRSSEPDGTIFGEDGLYVNKDGQRFTNESGYYARIFQNLYETDTAYYSENMNLCNAFMIVDEAMVNANEKVYYQADGSGQTWRTLIDNSKIDGFTYSGLDGGKTYEGATLEEAIIAAGLPLEETLATVARYNELCAAGEDTDFGKSAENMIAIGEEGPFYVWRVPLYSYNLGDSVGSPEIDTLCRALDADNEPIPGLYVTGYAANANFQWRMYVGSGSYIQYCVTTGRIAGADAAATLIK